jgi:hypothetical protein
MNVYIVMCDENMLSSPGTVPVIEAIFLSYEKAQKYIDDKNIVAKRLSFGKENEYDPDYYPFPYSIEEHEVMDED